MAAQGLGRRGSAGVIDGLEVARGPASAPSAAVRYPVKASASEAVFLGAPKDLNLNGSGTPPPVAGRCRLAPATASWRIPVRR